GCAARTATGSPPTSIEALTSGGTSNIVTVTLPALPPARVVSTVCPCENIHGSMNEGAGPIVPDAAIVPSALRTGIVPAGPLPTPRLTRVLRGVARAYVVRRVMTSLSNETSIQPLNISSRLCSDHPTAAPGFGLCLFLDELS